MVKFDSQKAEYQLNIDAGYYNTLDVCRYTYCSNMAKSGMKPKTLQYFMGHSDIAITHNVYTYIGLDDATEELRKLEEMENACR